MVDPFVEGEKFGCNIKLGQDDCGFAGDAVNAHGVNAVGGNLDIVNGFLVDGFDTFYRWTAKGKHAGDVGRFGLGIKEFEKPGVRDGMFIIKG